MKAGDFKEAPAKGIEQRFVDWLGSRGGEYRAGAGGSATPEIAYMLNLPSRAHLSNCINTLANRKRLVETIKASPEAKRLRGVRLTERGWQYVSKQGMEIVDPLVPELADHEKAVEVVQQRYAEPEPPVEINVDGVKKEVHALEECVASLSGLERASVERVMLYLGDIFGLQFKGTRR